MKKMIFLTILLVISGFLLAKEVKAGTEDNVSGWAWSENIGWISFNCYNDYNSDGVLESHCIDAGYPSNYGVNVDLSTGLFSGYAWSENIGWIDFGPGGPYPTNPQYSTCLDLPGVTGESCNGVGDNQVSGWARALAGIGSGSGNGNGIAGLWHFDEGSGKMVYDSSGNMNTGTVSDNEGNQWVTGKYNSGIQFDGVDDQIFIPASPSLSNITTEDGGITLETWIKMDNLTGLHYIIDKCGDGKGGYCWAVEPQDPETGASCFTQQFGGDTENPEGMWLAWSCGSGPDEVGKWTHLAVTYSSSSHIVFYKNGEKVDEATLPSNYEILPSPNKNLILGYHLPATIDELIIYNGVLSPYEIKKRYEMGPLSPASGWDGWIKMRCDGTECTTSNYGVWRDTSTTPDEFRGWAWGSDVVGWISFNCANQGVCGTSNYKVFLRNLPPSATNLNVTSGDYCFATSPPVYLNWTFSGPEDSQSAYQVQVDNNSDFSSPEVNVCVYDPNQISNPIPGTCTSGNGGSSSFSPTLSFNTTYYWRVRVWDRGGLASDCGNPDGWCYPPNDPTISPFPTPPPGSSFSTLPRPPWPNFSWLPPSPSAGEVVQFCTVPQSGVCGDVWWTVYSGTGPSWAWDFDNDEIDDIVGSTLAEQNPTWVYSTSGPYTVKLTVSDSNGSCFVTRNLTISPPLPKWREIAPTVWLDLPKLVFQNLAKFLATILRFLI